MLMCILMTGSCFAQVENQFNKKDLVADSSENEIRRAASLKEQVEMIVAVYPNPSQGQLFIEGNSGSTVTIYSAIGTYIGTWEIGLTKKVEITDLPQGDFVCVINDGPMRKVKRIVVI